MEQNISLKIIYHDDGPYTLNNGTLLKKPLIPSLPGTVWRVGVAEWELLNSTCLLNPQKCAKGKAGLDLEILSLIAKILNVTMKFVLDSSPNGGCGQNFGGRNWTGLISMLMNDEIDIAGNLCTINKYRTNLSFATNSLPVLRYRQSFLIKKPEPMFHFHVWGPFSEEIWYLLLATVLVYPIVDSVLQKMFSNKKFFRTLPDSFVQSLQLIAGMKAKAWNPYTWFVWTVFVSFFSLAYSAYVKAAIINPATVERPFRNNLELLEALRSKQYKFIDYKEKIKIAYPRSNNDTTDEKMKSVILDVGYQHSKSGGNPKILLQEILDGDNLVYAKGRTWMDTYLDTFSSRANLWVMDDDLAADEISAYIYRNDFASKQYFDLALLIVRNFQTNFNNRYRGLFRQAHHKSYVKGDVPDKVVLDTNTLFGPLICYFIGIAISVLSFIVENVKKKNWFSRTKCFASYNFVNNKRK